MRMMWGRHTEKSYESKGWATWLANFTPTPSCFTDKWYPACNESWMDVDAVIHQINRDVIKSQYMDVTLWLQRTYSEGYI